VKRPIHLGDDVACSGPHRYRSQFDPDA
jgi:hypothetical protein